MSAAPRAARAAGVALLALYLTLALATLAAWHQQNAYGPEGDEPWYLVMASGITMFGTLEQSRPQAHESAHRAIVPAGLPPYDPAHPEPSHAVDGPNGRFSVHNAGLPALLALPYLMAGVAGARLAMVLVSAIAVLVVWRASGLWMRDPGRRLLVTASLCIGLPLLPAAGQIYPDVPAGVICLFLLWRMLVSAHPRLAEHAARGLLLAVLPWLQLRFALPAVVLGVAFAAILARAPRGERIGAALALAVPGLVSTALLAGYNLHAFGRLTGPYGEGALQAGAAGLLAFVGLHIDQNQGMLVQNPMLLLGLAGLAWLARSRPGFAVTVVLVHLALVVPPALHPNWYGGLSFVGRFGWSAALVLMLPALAGAARLLEGWRAGWLVPAACLVLQAALYVDYTWRLGDWALYNASVLFLPVPALAAYPVFHPGAWNWLPALYGVDEATWRWAFAHAPNLAAAGLVLLLLAAGAATARGSSARFAGALAAWAVVAVVALAGATRLAEPGALPGAPPARADGGAWTAAALPGQSRTHGDARVAEPGHDAPGFLQFGLYQRLERAAYHVTLTYASDAAADAVVGRLEVRPLGGDLPPRTFPLPGTSGATRTLTAPVPIATRARVYELRVLWPGAHDLRLERIVLQRDAAGAQPTDHPRP